MHGEIQVCLFPKTPGRCACERQHGTARKKQVNKQKKDIVIGEGRSCLLEVGCGGSGENLEAHVHPEAASA